MGYFGFVIAAAMGSSLLGAGPTDRSAGGNCFSSLGNHREHFVQLASENPRMPKPDASTSDDGKTEKTPAISTPTIHAPTGPSTQRKRLDDPTVGASPSWKPGDPVTIMPDLKKSKE